MEEISEETYKHKDRMFKIKVTKEADGFHVRAIDEVTRKVIDHGKCSYKVYNLIRNRKFSRDAVEGIIEVIKHTLSAWINKGLI